MQGRVEQECDDRYSVYSLGHAVKSNQKARLSSGPLWFQRGTAPRSQLDVLPHIHVGMRRLRRHRAVPIDRTDKNLVSADLLGNE